jgi:ABC-type lipoprotein release transport system permease subunit
VVVGRLAWRSFAQRLGVATDPSISVGWILATVAGGLLLSLVAAAVPARTAARATPGAVLRSE